MTEKCMAETWRRDAKFSAIHISFICFFSISNSTIETLGGFFLIEAKDMNEAVQVASRWPSARLGSIEVRPVDDGLREDKRYA